jgi:hypothetical protein
VGALVSVVALAARAPLDGSTRVNASSAGTPLTALFVLGIGAGLIGLCALIVFLWPGPRGRDGEPEHERAPLQLHWAWKVALIMLPFALGGALLVAAEFGVRAFQRPAPLIGSGSLPHAVVAPPASGHGARGFALPSWLPWTALAILAIAVVLGVVALLLRRSRTLDEVSARAPAARAAVEAAISALDSSPDPRDAVIAAYAAMERSFAAHDLGRLAPEAPREYLRRVLAASAAPTQQAATITGCFEEARFSTHPISENARSWTLAALSAVRASLGAPPERRR